MRFKEIEKYASIMQDKKTKCACGHTLIIPPQIDKVICHWCGKYVFKTKEAEFKYRMKENMNRQIEK